MDVLVVYYSRTGNTAQLAKVLAERFSCPSEAIIDTQDRSGLTGWLHSSRQAIKKELTTIEPVHHDPGSFDLIVVGTPIWEGDLSTPVRTYLHAYKEQLPAIAFFCTYGGRNPIQSFTDKCVCCGLHPIATLVLTENQVKKEDWTPDITAFVTAIHEKLGGDAP